jgi:glycine/D-amino acid oxidase-like deaminating enzyme/nitrite reductase/ring-hydroxylating ferredoxin subunit
MAEIKTQDAIALLKEDHRTVEELFEQFEKAKGDGRKQKIAQQICMELSVHAKIEEEIFYPACEGKIEEDLLKEAYVEHDGAKVLIAEIDVGRWRRATNSSTPRSRCFRSRSSITSRKKSSGWKACSRQARKAGSTWMRSVSSLPRASADDNGPGTSRRLAVMRTTSFWVEDIGLETRPPLTGHADCDLVVVGSGIAGLSSAYEAARFGWRVIVIERHETIGGVMTPRTTAHLASELDDYYYYLIKAVGEEDARTYYESQVAAINRIEAICRDDAIDADLRGSTVCWCRPRLGTCSELEQEYDACQTLGVDVEWIDDASVPLPEGTRALRFPNQGRFHPLKYIRGLTRAIEGRGGRIHGGTVYVKPQGRRRRRHIETEAGHTIRAKAAMFATNSPVNDKVTIHTKQLPDRTYVVAGPVPKGSVARRAAVGHAGAYHYVRLQPLSETEDLLIVGGEDHRSGEANDMDERFAQLETGPASAIRAFAGARYRWSGQVLEPVDFMPYSGRNPGDRNIYVHTGDSGQGMTNGVAGAINFAALLFEQKAHFAEVLDPSRKPKAGTSLSDFLTGRAHDVKNLTEHLTGGEISSIDELAPGEGAIIRRGMAKIAAYRAEDGTVIERSAVCTHVGCIIHWNGLEKCWDCPCHGSQFQPDGSVINGPAVEPLAEVE